jgi:hypothetical protein
VLNIDVDTLKHTQHFAAQCIGVFIDHDVFTDGPLHLRLQALEFVLRHCSERVSKGYFKM